jgi:hypothetical protein
MQTVTVEPIKNALRGVISCAIEVHAVQVPNVAPAVIFKVLVQVQNISTTI